MRSEHAAHAALCERAEQGARIGRHFAAPAPMRPRRMGRVRRMLARIARSLTPM